MLPAKILFALLISSLQIFAAPSPPHRLVDVNAQWLKNPQELAAVEEDFSRLNEQEMIQKHLLLVHQILTERETEQLSPEKKQRRSKSLDQLFKYANRGVFPQNITHPGRRPVFIDHRGVHCAVGYLIKMSGNPQLSEKISNKMNYAYLLNMEDDELSEWVAQSGFTAGELAWIQPGYPMVVNWNDMKGGVNHPVLALAGDQMGGIYAGGHFDTAGTGRFPHFTQWFSGIAGFDWGFFHPAPNGPVHDILYHNNKYYVGGSFYAIDTVTAGAAVAVWDGSQWKGLGDFYIGALFNFVNDLAFYRDTLYAAGFFRSKAGTTPMFNSLAKWNGTEWVKATPDTNLPGIIYGEINALHVHNGRLIVGGLFTLDNSQQTQNIFALNGNTFESFNEDLPYPVEALETYNNELYAGSLYIDTLVGDTAGLTVYRNGKWESLVDFVPASEQHVSSLLATPHGLVLGGDFSLANLMSMGQNIALYDGQVRSLGILDGAVKTLLFQNDQLYVGGEFTHGFNGSYIPLGHVTHMRLADYVGLEESPQSSIKIFPNPAAHSAKVEMADASPVREVIVYDVLGKKHNVEFEQIATELKLDLSRLTDGVYFVMLKFDAASYSERLVVKH